MDNLAAIANLDIKTITDKIAGMATDIIFKTDGGMVDSFLKCSNELAKETPDYFLAGYYFAKFYTFILPQNTPSWEVLKDD